MEGVSRDPDRAAIWRAGWSREPPSGSPERSHCPLLPPPHWPTRQSGAPSHGCKGAVLRCSAEALSHLCAGACARPPPRRPPKQRPRCSGKTKDGRPAPQPTWRHSWPAGCPAAWLPGFCASGRLVSRAGCLGAECLDAVRLDADDGMLHVRTPGRLPARTSGSLTLGRAPAALRPALARPAAPPAPALLGPGPPLAPGGSPFFGSPLGGCLGTSLSL